MAFKALVSPSAPKLTTVIPWTLHCKYICFHRLRTSTALKLLFVPTQARQKAGTCFERAWAIYTYANLAISLSLNILSIAENEVAINELQSDRPLVSHGSTNPTIMSVSLSYSALAITLVEYSAITTTLSAL